MTKIKGRGAKPHCAWKNFLPAVGSFGVSRLLPKFRVVYTKILAEETRDVTDETVEGNAWFPTDETLVGVYTL